MATATETATKMDIDEMPMASTKRTDKSKSSSSNGANTGKSNANQKSTGATNNTATLKTETPEERSRKDRDAWFQSRLQKVAEELEQLSKGTHREYIAKIQKLEMAKNARIEAAERYRRLQLENINATFEATKKQAMDEFEEEVSNLKSKMQNALIDKQKRIEDEKNDQIPFPEEFIERGVTTRKLRRRSGKVLENDKAETDKADRTLRGDGTSGLGAIGGTAGAGGGIPYTYSTYKKKLPMLNINLSLKDDEIMDDLAAINKRAGRR